MLPLHTEAMIYRAVLDGELKIDEQGRIWRIAKRGWDRWNKRVRLNKCAKVRAEHPTPQGYLQIRVMFNGHRIYLQASRLVYFHFFGHIPLGMTINHKNGVKPDNKPSNLELMDYRQQAIHARHVLKVGRLDQNGEKNAMAKLTRWDVVKIRSRRLNGESLRSIASDYNVGFKAVSKIARGDRWAHVSG